MFINLIVVTQFMVLERLLTNNKAFFNSKGDKVNPVPLGKPVIVCEEIINSMMGSVRESVEEQVEQLLMPFGANAYIQGEATLLYEKQIKYYPIQFYRLD